MTMDVEGYITRGTDDALVLEDEGKYAIVAFDMGAVSWRRQSAKSLYQHGEFVTNAVKDVMVASITVRVYGQSASELESRAADLTAAFERFTFRLSVTLDGQEWRYQCNQADYAMNSAGGGEGGFDKFAQGALQRVYTFHVPRSPIPVAGAF